MDVCLLGVLSLSWIYQYHVHSERDSAHKLMAYIRPKITENPRNVFVRREESKANQVDEERNYEPQEDG